MQEPVSDHPGVPSLGTAEAVAQQLAGLLEQADDPAELSAGLKPILTALAAQADTARPDAYDLPVWQITGGSWPSLLSTFSNPTCRIP